VHFCPAFSSTAGLPGRRFYEPVVSSVFWSKRRVAWKSFRYKLSVNSLIVFWIVPINCIKHQFEFAEQPDHIIIEYIREHKLIYKIVYCECGHIHCRNGSTTITVKVGHVGLRRSKGCQRPVDRRYRRVTGWSTGILADFEGIFLLGNLLVPTYVLY
jgi:hypothetical protein